MSDPLASSAASDRDETRVRAVEDALAKARRGEPLTAKEFATILGVGKSEFNRRELAGAYDAFKLKPAIGERRFAGALVARYLEGEPIFEDLRGRARLRVAN